MSKRKNQLDELHDEGDSSRNIRVGKSQEKLFEILNVTQMQTSVSKMLRREELVRVVDIKHNLENYGEDIWAIHQQVDEAWKTLLNEIITEANDEDVITGYIEHSELAKDIWIAPKRKCDLRYDEFLNAIGTVTQSNKTFLLDGRLTIRVGVIKPRTGAARRNNRAPQPMHERSKKKRSILTITEADDVSCFWLAVVSALNYSSNIPYCQKKNYRRFKARLDAKNLAGTFGVRPNDSVSFTDLTRICEKLDLNIVVVSGDGTNKRLFPTNKQNIRRDLHPVILEYIETSDSYIGHFNVITSLKGYIEYTEFCMYCWTRYHYRNHKCDYTCSSCMMQNNSCSEMQPIKCDACEIVCYGPNCLEKHQEKCSNYTTCVTCLVRYEKKEKHSCFMKKCRKCFDKYNTLKGPHYCYISNIPITKLQEADNRLKVTVAFDIESMLVPTEKNPNIKEHVADLLISQAKCDMCMLEPDKKCQTNLCETRQRVFRGDQCYKTNRGCVKDFCDYIYNDLAKRAELQNASVYVYAHNLSSYDGRFIFRDLFMRDYGQPDFIQEGSQIIYMKIGNVRFHDSLKLFSLPLKLLPKAFGLSSRKGYFPYEANVPENRHKIIPLPSKEAFGYRTTMKKDDQIKFDVWYSIQPSTYDLEFEKQAYCADDVKILLESLIAFRKNLYETTGFDSTVRKFTMASIGMEVFRTIHLSDSQTLARTPTGGYNQRRSSAIGEAFLRATEDKLSIKIMREVNIGRYFADGYHEDTNTIYEYNGCHYHACTCLFTNEEEVVFPSGKSVSKLREDSETKIKTYKRLGFNLVIARDCDNQLLVETQKHFKEIKHGHKRLEAVGQPKNITLRSALKGGRTNNLKFYYRKIGGSSMKYVDFTSLYPSVLKKCVYPKGHPERITRNFERDPTKYFGFIHCEIKPPDQLHVPVLGVTLNNKFIFPLCRTCGNVNVNDECTHTDRDRNLVGVWTTVEIEKALDKGYEIIQIFEVLHYREKHTDLFREYVDMFLREKQEAEGRMGMTDQNFSEYLKNYFEQAGITLRPEKIQESKNMGARTLAKLFLNSFWGKMAQKSNLTQHKIFSNHDDYYNLLVDPKYEILGEFMPDDKNIIVSYKMKNENDAEEGVQNVAVASFVTSYARLELYKIIDEVGTHRPGSCYYFDTDSLIYEVQDGEDVLAKLLSPYLGGLTSDIEDEHEITSATFTGPKCYSLTVVEGLLMKTTTKIKGLTLTAEAEKTVTHKKLKELALEFENAEIVNKSSITVDQFRIEANPRTHQLFSRIMQKDFRVTSDKRRVISKENRTIPYGHRQKI